MKTNFTTLALLSALLMAFTAQAQTTYLITSNKSWSGNSMPLSCVNCTITISSGVTLIIDKDVACQNCTFNGGSISMNNQTLTLQTNGGLKTYFNNTGFTINGSGKIVGSAPIVITGSIFTFNNTASFISQKQIDLSGSKLYFNNNSNYMATGGPVNLSNNSYIIAGDGTATGTAYVFINGPTLNINDNSAIVLVSDKNYYFNWSNYNGNGHSYSTSPNSLNCGAGHSNACATPYVYGAASITSGGLVSFNSLPVTITDFSAGLLNNHTVAISWITQQESNSASFTIERSADGSQWTTVGTVAAKGNSSIASKYVFTDNKPVDGVNEYRLKMTDLDGSFTYSSVRAIHNTVPANISIFPNPTHDYVNISLGQSSSATAVRLMNANGQLLQERIIARGTTGMVSLPVQKYAAGMYLVQIANADGSSQNSALIINGK